MLASDSLSSFGESVASITWLGTLYDMVSTEAVVQTTCCVSSVPSQDSEVYHSAKRMMQGLRLVPCMDPVFCMSWLQDRSSCQDNTHVQITRMDPSFAWDTLKMPSPQLL